MKSFAIRLLAVNLLLLGVAACDSDRVVDREVVVHENETAGGNVNECPRDDGQPCK